MVLNTQDLIHLCSLAENCAKKAGQHVMTCLKKEQQVMHKNAGESLASQVVTETDFESQEIILNELKESIEQYDLGLLTEESTDDKSRFSKDYFWCIDPLDGTLPFTKRVAGFSISIALVSKDGEPVVGVVYDPVKRNLYSAVKGRGALKNNKKWIKPEPRQDFTWIYDQSFLKDKHYPLILEELKNNYNKVHERGTGGAVMNAIWVIEETPALYVKPPKEKLGGGSIWDFAATTCIFQALGLRVSKANKKPLNLNSADTTFMNKQGVLFSSLSEDDLILFRAY